MKNKKLHLLYFLLLLSPKVGFSDLTFYGKNLTNEEVTEKLKETAIEFPHLSLEARQKNKNEVFFYQEKGDLIKRISIDVLNKKTLSELHSLEGKYLNETDNHLRRQSFLADIENILKNHGYTNPFIKLEIDKYKKNLSYKASVKKGPLCRISAVETNFKNSSPIILDIKIGDTCSTREIEKKIKFFTEKVKKYGYENAILTFSEFNFSEDKKSASFSISGQLGEAVSYKLIETKRTGLLDKFLWFKIKQHPFDDMEGKYTTQASLSHKIEEFYLNRGYFDVFVNKPQRIKEKNNKKTIVYKVEPGSFYQVGNISIIGNQNFSRNTLLKITRKNYFDFTQKRHYSEKELNEFVEALYAFYYQRGYWNVKIQKVNNIDREKLNIAVTLRIKEDKRHILQSLKITGNSKVAKEVLQKKILLKNGEPISPEKIEKTIISLSEIYQEKSYFDISIKPNFTSIKSTSTEERIRLTLNIQEGKRYKIKKISISGLEKTKRDFIEKYLDFKEGDFYSLNTIEKSRTRLLDLGIFNSVNFSRYDVKSFNSNDQLVDIHVDFQESNQGNISFGPGFDLKSGFLYQLDLFYKNPTGRAHKILFTTAISEEKDQPYVTSSDNTSSKSFRLGTSFGVTHSNPYFFHRNVKQTLSLFYKKGSFSDESSSLWVSTIDLKLQFEWDLNFLISNSKIITYYHFLKSKEEGISSNRIPLLSIPDSTYSVFGIGYILDYRDSSILPQKGFYLEAIFDVSSQFLYGDFFYLKNKVLLSYYYKLYENYVLAFHYSDESYNFVKRVSHKNQEEFLPRARRLFINSPDKVRGFKDDLGPYSSDLLKDNSRKALGGTNSLVYKAELRAYKIYSMFGLTLFLDGGNTFFPQDQSEHIKNYYAELNNQDPKHKFSAHDLAIRPRIYEVVTSPANFFGNLYHSIGLSLNLALPIGILNFSLSYPLSEPKDSSWKRINYDNPIKNVKLELNIGTYF